MCIVAKFSSRCARLGISRKILEDSSIYIAALAVVLVPLVTPRAHGEDLADLRADLRFAERLVATPRGYAGFIYVPGGHVEGNFLIKLSFFSVNATNGRVR